MFSLSTFLLSLGNVTRIVWKQEMAGRLFRKYWAMFVQSHRKENWKSSEFFFFWWWMRVMCHTCCFLPCSPLLAAIGDDLKPITSWHACDGEVGAVGIVEQCDAVQLSGRLVEEREMETIIKQWVVFMTKRWQVYSAARRIVSCWQMSRLYQVNILLCKLLHSKLVSYLAE